MRILIPALLLSSCVTVDKLAHVPIGTQVLVAGANPVLEVRSPYSGHRDNYFPIRGAATALTITGDGRKTVVARAGGLTVVDLLNERVARFIDLGETPAGVAMLDRRRHVLAAVPGALLEVDLQAARVERRLETGVDEPVGLAFDRERGHALIAGADACAWIDVASGEARPVSMPVSMDMTPRAMLRLPGSTRAWVVGGGGGVAVDLADGRTSALTLPTPDAAGLFFDWRGELAAISDPGRRSLFVLDLPGGEQRFEVPLDGRPGAVLVEPKGVYAWVALPDSEQVTVVDLERGVVTGTFAVDGPAHVLGITIIRRWDPHVSSGEGGSD